MKDIDDIFDVVLLIVVLAAMLPTMIRSVISMQDMGNWGFRQQADKTAQIFTGDYISHTSDEEELNAYEVIALLLSSNNTCIKYNRVILPDSTVIDMSDARYNDSIKRIVNELIESGALTADKKYTVTFVYSEKDNQDRYTVISQEET